MLGKRPSFSSVPYLTHEKKKKRGRIFISIYGAHERTDGAKKENQNIIPKTSVISYASFCVAERKNGYRKTRKYGYLYFPKVTRKKKKNPTQNALVSFGNIPDLCYTHCAMDSLKNQAKCHCFILFRDMEHHHWQARRPNQHHFYPMQQQPAMMPPGHKQQHDTSMPNHVNWSRRHQDELLRWCDRCVLMPACSKSLFRLLRSNIWLKQYQSISLKMTAHFEEKKKTKMMPMLVPLS